MGVESVLKIQEGRPNAGDLMVNKEITMLFITTTGAPQTRCRASEDSRVRDHPPPVCPRPAQGSGDFGF